VGDRLADQRRTARTLARRFAVHGEASASVGGNVRPWVESGQLLPAIADMAIPKGPQSSAPRSIVIIARRPRGAAWA
jgi:hypothetical protein